MHRCRHISVDNIQPNEEADHRCEVDCQSGEKLIHGRGKPNPLTLELKTCSLLLTPFWYTQVDMYFPSSCSFHFCQLYLMMFEYLIIILFTDQSRRNKNSSETTTWGGTKRCGRPHCLCGNEKCTLHHCNITLFSAMCLLFVTVK